MRIGLLSPSIYMSSIQYGDMIFAPRDLCIALADGLVEKGNQVYFFTAPDIATKAHLIPGDENLLSGEFVEQKLMATDPARLKWGSFYNTKTNYEMDLTEKAFKMAKDDKLDIIHSYHDTLAHFFNDLNDIPTVYTLHDPLPKNKKSLSYWLFSKFSNHNYVSISNAFRKSSLSLNFVGTVYHGIDISPIPFLGKPDEYLACIGRMVPEKGFDSAIDSAKKTKKILKIATSSMEEIKRLAYFQNIINPKIDASISFVGYMSKTERFDFLSKALALLFPIQWEEPFGLVMVEAMACGTPVIAYNRGSVSEIVRDGVTGFIIDPDNEDRPGKGTWIIKKQGIEGLVDAIHRIGEIDRKACRKHVEDNFTIEKMVDGYEKVYSKIISK